MLHLFNKVYLEFDDKIEINFDRVVISEKYGIKMLEALDKVSQGELITFGKTYDEVVSSNLVAFVKLLKDFGNTSGKKIIVYCDKQAYKNFIAQWFKVILPQANYATFKIIVDHTIYNQRVVSNTQLSSVYSLEQTTLWENFDDLETHWNDAKDLTDDEKINFKSLGLNLSYELLLADYLSGSTNYETELRKTMHTFLRRWFKESFTDNRQMVLLNIGNHRFQQALGIDASRVDITSTDPLANIPQLSAYADDSIWEKQGIFCDLQDLSQTQIDSLTSTIMSIYKNFEGMEIDRSVFSLFDYLGSASRSELTKVEMDNLLDFIVNNPFDTNLVPRFDFQNVNFVLMLYFLRQKYEGGDLSKFKLV
jgi:hypothetical protein